MILTMLLDILCTMGLPSVDDSLQRLLNAMHSFPAELGSTEGIARLVGCGIALGVGSYEAWMMMLGRRGIDVMKILRIIILSICITSSTTICSAIKAPGESLEESAHNSLNATQILVKQKEEQVAQLQKRYLDRLTFVQDSIYKAKEVAAIGKDAGTFRQILYNVQNLGATIDNLTKKAAVVAESKITEWINDVIRFIGQLIFQMAYYGMFVAQRCFMAMMQAFAPLMFALSLAPPWKSAWSQWMSKFISISLWGWGIYTVMLYVDYILMYNLDADIEAYTRLIGGTDNSWGQIGALGLQGIGSNCMYAMGMLAAAIGISVLADGLFKLRIAADARTFGIERWWLILALAAVTCGVGALLVLRPGQGARLLARLLGTSLLCEGALNLCVAVSTVKIIDHQHPDVIETEYTEIERYE